MRVSIPSIGDFLFDDRNEDKMAEHGIRPRQVMQFLENEHVVVPNRKNRAAPLLLIGKDNGGACISVPIVPTHEPGTWYPITAWYSKESERDRLERS